MRNLFGFIFFILATPNVEGQVDTLGMVRYSHEYPLNEGFYLNFEQVRTNNPLPKSRVITSVSITDADFFSLALQGDRIGFYDDLGARQEVATRNIWGYCRNGVIHVRVGDGFNRVTVVGSISHFVASVTTYNSRHNDPYYYRSYGYNPYGYGRSTYPTTESRQFVMDFETGKVMDFTVQSMEILLMKDPELHDEYQMLRRKKKQQLKFFYIRKFNERNPLYFPLYVE
jgi:hypothetical protein